MNIKLNQEEYRIMLRLINGEGINQAEKRELISLKIIIVGGEIDNYMSNSSTYFLIVATSFGHF